MNLDPFLSEQTYNLNDSSSGKPVATYRIVKDMPSFLFNENRDKIEYMGSHWGYVTSSITREECIKLYGEITNEEFGPRGGWKSVTFGKTRFISNRLRPIHETI